MTKEDRINIAVRRIVEEIHSRRDFLEDGKESWAVLVYTVASVVLTRADGDIEIAEENVGLLSKSVISVLRHGKSITVHHSVN